MQILLDENISCKIARVLEIVFGNTHSFSTMADLELCGCSDTDWIDAVSRMELPPVVFTYDLSIRKNHNEVTSLRNSNLTVFMFKSCGSMRLPEQVWRTIRIMPLLEQYSREHPGHTMEVDPDKQKIKVKI